MQITVRFASSVTDSNRVFHLRAAIYDAELGRAHNVDGDGLMTDPLDETGRLLLAEHDGEVVATLRINWGGDAPFAAEDRAIYRLDLFETVLAPAQIAIFSRFAAKPSYRGGDAPGQLIDALIRFSLAHGVALILCDCRPELINTYFRLGMHVAGPLVTTAGAELLVPLALLLDDREHLHALQSRIVPLLHGIDPDPDRRDAIRALLPPDPAVRLLDHAQDTPEWTRIVDVLAQDRSRVPICQDLSPEQIARLTTSANLISCNQGDVILRQGSAGEMIFVLLDGAVDVVRRGAPVTRLAPGSVVGDIAFLTQVRRTADIVATTDSRLLCLRPSTLKALIANAPTLAATFLLNLARILATRVAATTASADIADVSELVH
ncbi:MAG: cyclic nucleotide-binding domain-containing protein [Janthinobacterium lividum]